jgi:DNA-binding IclR family transcriptional regulator
MGGSVNERGRAVPPVETVRRALRILGCFGVQRPELGVSEVARELNMHKSTVHRLLLTFETEGFVRSVDGGRYVLSWKVFELGTAIPVWREIHQAVFRALESLVAETGETAHLAVLESGEVLYIEKVESPHRLRMPSAVGRRVPPHCTALGKVLLAGLDPASQKRMIYGATLRALTPSTIVDPERLWQEVQDTRARGFAIDHEEIEEGLMCVAAPVSDDLGTICGAISIAGPTPRIQRRLDQHVDAVRATCRSLSGELGAKARGLKEACVAP